MKGSGKEGKEKRRKREREGEWKVLDCSRVLRKFDKASKASQPKPDIREI